ncbi:MAG: hypothetical protein HUK11_04190 [Muribaculaceae bacterium]|nr:hypothetical protein [Muribaculaceae bacterium]
MLKRLYATLTALLLLAGNAMAQEVAWSVDMSVMFQNREGGDELTPDQTILFTRLAPEVGLSLMGGAHEIKGGVAWYQPLIDNLKGYKVLPTIYYKYHSNGWTLAAGALPRSLMLRPLPRLLMSDSLNFVTPNVRGVLARYEGKRGHGQIDVDWRQMQTTTQREAFVVTFDTHCNIAGPLGFDAWLQYNHLAKCKDAGNTQGVNDDVTLMLMPTLDLAHYTPRLKALELSAGAALLMQRDRSAIDSKWHTPALAHYTPRLKALELSAGAALLMQRDRSAIDSKWHTPARFMARAHMAWRWLEAAEEFSTGGNAFPLYPSYGSELNLGDPYYCYKTYSRTDVRAHIVNNSFVDLNAGLTFHVTNKTTGFWQTISCRVYIDNYLWKQRHDKAALTATKLNPIF